MAELFESYASDYDQLKASITAKLDHDAPGQAGEAQKATLRRVEMELEEADEVISQMEIEVNSFPTSLKTQYSTKVRGYRTDVDKFKGQLRAAMQRASGRDGAGGAGPGEGGTGFNDDLESGRSSYDTQAQRQRLLQGTATLDDGSRRLQDSHRLALETEDLGADILRDLRGQREQIEHSRDTVSCLEIRVGRRKCVLFSDGSLTESASYIPQLRNADSNIDRSSRTIGQMIRR